MTALERLRRRLPFAVFLLLLVLAVLFFGFACACITDHPALAIERALAGLASLPPLTEVWSLLVAALAPAATVILRTRSSLVRGSPAELQRFLF